MTAAIAVGLLVAGGVYLMLQRELLRVTIGFVLLGHAVNVLFLAAGGMERRGAPLIGQMPLSEVADPLPQAFVLTAIVITFGVTVYLLAMLRAGGSDGYDSDELPHDPGDPSAANPTELTGAEADMGGHPRPGPPPAHGAGHGTYDKDTGPAARRLAQTDGEEQR